jgi:hypothetical protein
MINQQLFAADSLWQQKKTLTIIIKIANDCMIFYGRCRFEDASRPISTVPNLASEAGHHASTLPIFLVLKLRASHEPNGAAPNLGGCLQPQTISSTILVHRSFASSLLKYPTKLCIRAPRIGTRVCRPPLSRRRSRDGVVVGGREEM